MIKKIIPLALLSIYGQSNFATAAEPKINLNLSPVVVTATRTEAKSFDLPVSIDVISSETLHDGQQGVNLSETSMRVPGVIINNRNNTAQDLSVSTRGFGARSQFGVRGVRLYADGIPLTMPDGQGQTGTFNLDTAEQIEFMRGPFSALYGNSSGGVVQIFTRDGAKTPTISGSTNFGSYGTKRQSLTAEGQIGDLNYIVNTSHYETNGYRDFTAAKRDLTHTKFSYKPNDDTKVTFVASYLDQPDAQDPGGITPTQFKQDSKQVNSASVYTANQRSSKSQTQAGLTIDHNFSESQSVRLMTYYGVRDNMQFQTLPGVGNVCGPLSSASCNRAVGIDRSFGGFDARWSYKDTLAGKPFSVSAGVNYDAMSDDRRTYNTYLGEVNPTNPLTRSEMQRVKNFDQYLQATFEPTNQWLVIGGLRHSRIDFEVNDNFLRDGNSGGNNSYTNTSPVFGATYKVTPAFNLYANYGTGFETPTFIEVTYDDPNAGTGPNRRIQPSKSKNYEIGAKAFLFDNTRVNLAFFKVNTEKEIAVAQGTGTTASFQNAGDTERYGMELALNSALPNNFNFYSALSLINAEFQDSFNYCTSRTGSNCSGSNTSNLKSVNSGNKIPGVYSSTFYNELSWKYPQLGFSTALESVHLSDTYTDDLNRSSHKADSFTLFNLRAGFTQFVGNWRLNEFARVDNVGDRNYVSSVRINNDSAFETGAGRNWTMGLSASYKF